MRVCEHEVLLGVVAQNGEHGCAKHGAAFLRNKEATVVMPEQRGQGTRVTASRPRQVRATLGCEVQQVDSSPSLGPCWFWVALRVRQGSGEGQRGREVGRGGCLCHLDGGWPWETGERHATGKLCVCVVDGNGMGSRAALEWTGRCVVTKGCWR